MPILDDIIRPYQLPNNAPAELFRSQYGLASHPPVVITPGMNGGGIGQFPPIQTGRHSFHGERTVYVPASYDELVQAGGVII